MDLAKILRCEHCHAHNLNLDPPMIFLQSKVDPSFSCTHHVQYIEITLTLDGANQFSRNNDNIFHHYLPGGASNFTRLVERTSTVMLDPCPGIGGWVNGRVHKALTVAAAELLSNRSSSCSHFYPMLGGLPTTCDDLRIALHNIICTQPAARP